MADNKKYYWLKLKDNFFDIDSMIVLESMPDGYLYSNILLKLYLKSLKYDGKLMFNERIPYNPTILAQVTRHNVGVVEKALQIFQDLELVEVLDNGAIYMLDIQNFIGTSSTEADRKRRYREKIKEEKESELQLIGQMSTISETNVHEQWDKRPPEKEIEKEIDLQLEGSMVRNSNEISNSDFDYKILNSQIKICHAMLIDEKGSMPYDLNDYIEVFTYFYQSYEEYIGQAHPKIRSENIKKVMEDLPYIQGGNADGEDVDPEANKLMIDAYFKQPWGNGINPTIIHFMSGNIRALRWYEKCY